MPSDETVTPAGECGAADSSTARGRIHHVRNVHVIAAGNRVARALDQVGVPTRATVALLGANTPEFLATHRGVTWSGRTLTPLSWRWTADEVAYVAADCEAKALVADARFPALAQAAAGVIRPEARFAYGGQLPGFRPWREIDTLPPAPPDVPLAGRIMMYTSGTTGRPKGVLQPEPSGPPPTVMGAAGMSMLRLFLPPEQERGTHLVCTPLYHAGPLTYADGSLLLGADLVLLERFDPETVLRLIAECKIVSTFMVPTHFVRLLRLPDAVRARYDLRSLKLLLHGSAPVAPDIKRAMIEWLGPLLFEFYGGTEGGGTAIDSRTWLTHPGSVGRPIPGYELAVLDDHGAPLPTGTPGQIWFRGGSRFAYKGDPEKTAQVQRDDWHTLGDIGSVDAEGFLYLCDRRADVIISGGVNIYPAQIEAALLACPEVVDCCVIGIPDDEWGEAVHAVVQPAAGSTAGPALAARVLAAVRSRLAAYQVPRSMEFRTELPRTETGKLARRQIRDPYWQGRQRRI